ncbi:MAG: hypothetical protein IPG04_07735 [Polyangiaceae bacterium]|nr:hypothetical protein [Polyangiaceae bacterium]
MFWAIMVLPSPCGATSTTLRADLEEVEAHDGLDERSLDLRGPVPVEVGHGLESLEAAACATPIKPASGAVLLLDVDHVLKELLRAPSLLGRQRDQIIGSGCGGKQAEGVEPRLQAAHWSSSGAESRDSAAR